MSSEWKNFGPLQFLFGGLTAKVSYMILDAGKWLLRKRIHDSMTNRAKAIMKTPKTLRRAVIGVYVIDGL